MESGTVLGGTQKMEVQYRCLTAEGLDNLPQAAEIRQEVFV